MRCVIGQEREVQKNYWMEHSADLTVEAMMLDSKAADLDKEERPEVSFPFFTISIHTLFSLFSSSSLFALFPALFTTISVLRVIFNSTNILV